mmetsp:Transcript_32797/g.103743  ORF Transcript_32797/g.103743 Transcript_32797/m.103743 type:complete len:261 (+) Transcript_32797:626-1408(+)
MFYGNFDRLLVRDDIPHTIARHDHVFIPWTESVVFDLRVSNHCLVTSLQAAITKRSRGSKKPIHTWYADLDDRSSRCDDSFLFIGSGRFVIVGEWNRLTKTGKYCSRVSNVRNINRLMVKDCRCCSRPVKPSIVHSNLQKISVAFKVAVRNRFAEFVHLVKVHIADRICKISNKILLEEFCTSSSRMPVEHPEEVDALMQGSVQHRHLKVILHVRPPTLRAVVAIGPPGAIVRCPVLPPRLILGAIRPGGKHGSSADRIL